MTLTGLRPTGNSVHIAINYVNQIMAITWSAHSGVKLKTQHSLKEVRPTFSVGFALHFALQAQN